MAFKPSKRPSSPATRREQRKASGNAALDAGRYQGIPSYDNDPDPVPVPRFSSRGGGMTPFGGLVDAFTGKDYSKEGKKQEFLQYMRDTAPRTSPPTNRFRDADKVSMNRYYATNRDIKERLAPYTDPPFSLFNRVQEKDFGMYGSAANELANSTMRKPTLKPTINSYGQQLLNTNSVNRVTGKGIASLANTWRDNPLINYNRNNPSSLLRTIVNYPANVATNLFKSIPGAATTVAGGIPDLLLGLNASEKTRADIAENLGTEVMSYLESTMGSGFGSRLFLNSKNINRYAKSLNESLDTSKKTVGVGGGGGVGGITAFNSKLDPWKNVSPSSKSPAVFDYKNADIAVNAARKADSKLTSPVESYFTTGKGSQYAVLENGQTIRFKAPRKGLLHEGQSGPQIPSSKTIFVDQKGSDVMLDFQRNSSQMGSNISQEVVPLANNKAHVVYLEDFGKFKKGDAVPNSTFSYTLKPETGKSPLEIMEGGRSAHIGTKITDTRTVGGGGSLSAPNVCTLTDAEKAGDKILDLGPGVRNRHVQVLKEGPEQIDKRKFQYSRKRDYDEENMLGDPDYLYDPRFRVLEEEEAIRKAIASRKNLDMTKEGVAARARELLEGERPTRVYRGTAPYKSDNRRVDNFTGMFSNTNPKVAKTYGDVEEFLFMRNPKKDGLVIDAKGEPYFNLPVEARTSYKGQPTEPLGNFLEKDWATTTNDLLSKIRRDKRDLKYFNPNSMLIEDIIDPRIIPNHGTKYLQGDNYITLDKSTLKRPTALMLEQFKKLSGFDYRSGGIVSLLK